MVSRWAYHMHGLTGGYWLLGWIVWRGVTGLAVAPGVRAIVDDHLSSMALGRWTIGDIQALNSHVVLSLGMLAKLLLLRVDRFSDAISIE